MPVPKEVTRADRARWERALSKSAPDVRDHARRTAKSREAWDAGCWLGEQLDAQDCPDELREMICIAAGQKMFAREDVWQEAQVALADYQRGSIPLPGPLLAEQLFQEQLARVGIEGVLRSVFEHELGKSDSEEP